MFDTYITVVGTVLTPPEWRRVQKTGAVVASFRIASNSRRFDKANDQWVDGPSLRVRVHCWRRLAEGVAASVMVGDPVVVHGRISTRDWKTEQGEMRVSYELEADTVGHDLSRGQAKFQRIKLDAPTAVVDDDDSAGRVNGEPSDPIDAVTGHLALSTAEQVEEYGLASASGTIASSTDAEAMAILRGAGLVPDDYQGVAAEEDEVDAEDVDEEEVVGPAAANDARGRARRRGRQPVPA